MLLLFLSLLCYNSDGRKDQNRYSHLELFEISLHALSDPIMSAAVSEGEQVKLLIKTVDFAAKKHAAQRRKDAEKTPYINHPVGVANILANEGGVSDVTVLQIRI